MTPSPPSTSTAIPASGETPVAEQRGESSKRPGSPGGPPATKKLAMEVDAKGYEVNSTSLERTAVTKETETRDGKNDRGDVGNRGGRGGRGSRRGRGGRVNDGDKRDKRNNRVWGPKEGTNLSTHAENSENAQESDGNGEPKKRLPKRKAAILMGYCGTGYSGMQIQPGCARTIEGEFFQALVKAGAVSADNSDDHRKVDVQRAARTDAGVHAAGNCISMKMILEPPLPPEYPTLASYVNSFLPEQIRMWGFVRTMKSFVARSACDSRIYEYLLPSYCLLPPSSSDILSQKMNVSSPGWRDALGVAAEFSDAGVAPMPEPGFGEGPQSEEAKMDPRTRGEYERRRGWRVDDGTMKRFRELIKEFEGSRNFHNYTLGKPYNDKTVRRYMMTIQVRDPQVVRDIEWVSVQIHGQSFMLHQIRKMMSLAMLACRTGSPASLISETYGPQRIHIPKAPPLGLLLEAPQFGLYNKRISSKPNGLESDHDPINWELYSKEKDAFKLKYIYDRLRKDELETHVFHKWIRQMDCTSSNLLAFLNTQGVIPSEAEISKNAKEETTKQTQPGVEARQDAMEEEMESDEEEVDQDLLKKGELEG